MSIILRGKFRHANKTVWCPKPKQKIDYEKLTIEQKQRLGQHFTVEEYAQYTKTLPMKEVKRTGWQNIDRCKNCEYLEEFHVDDEGVFCLYPCSSFDSSRNTEQKQ